MSADQLMPTLMGAMGRWLALVGVAVGDKQVRVRWGNWLLPEARVPRVNEQSRRVDDSTLKERHRAVFPLPTDASIEHTELGSREVRRMS